MPIEPGPPSWQKPLEAQSAQAFEQITADASGAAAIISRMAFLAVRKEVLRARSVAPIERARFVVVMLFRVVVWADIAVRVARCVRVVGGLGREREEVGDDCRCPEHRLRSACAESAGDFWRRSLALGPGMVRDPRTGGWLGDASPRC